MPLELPLAIPHLPAPRIQPSGQPQLMQRPQKASTTESPGTPVKPRPQPSRPLWPPWACHAPLESS